MANLNESEPGPLLQHHFEPYLPKVESQYENIVIGTGYVGLVTGTCLAEMGNEVSGKNFIYADSPMAALKNVDALTIVTE